MVYQILYRYNLNTRIQRNLTVDYHDDLDAKYAVINDIPGVLFSSNRDKSDVIPGGTRYTIDYWPI